MKIRNLNSFCLNFRLQAGAFEWRVNRELFHLKCRFITSESLEVTASSPGESRALGTIHNIRTQFVAQSR